MPVPEDRAPQSIRSHLTNDARFSVPASWEDRSVHVLTAPPAEDGGPPGGSLTLHRDPVQPGEGLAAYIVRQLQQLQDALPDVDILREGPRVVGGAPGWEVELRWTDERRLLLRQHQVSVLRDDPPPGRVLTWTATAPAAHYSEYADAFAEVLASVHLVPPAFVVPRAAGGG